MLTGILIFAIATISLSLLSEQAMAQSMMSPKQQMMMGTSPNQIVCADGKVLMMKHMGMPACVNPSTYWRLADRSWGNFDTELLAQNQNYMQGVMGTMMNHPQMSQYMHDWMTDNPQHMQTMMDYWVPQMAQNNQWMMNMMGPMMNDPELSKQMMNYMMMNLQMMDKMKSNQQWMEMMHGGSMMNNGMYHGMMMNGTMNCPWCPFMQDSMNQSMMGMGCAWCQSNMGYGMMGQGMMNNNMMMNQGMMGNNMQRSTTDKSTTTHGWMMQSPQHMQNMMNYMIGDPQSMQTMHGMMMQSPYHMYGMMNNMMEPMMSYIMDDPQMQQQMMNHMMNHPQMMQQWMKNQTFMDQMTSP
ncbi:hypothetical protein BD31_I1829 [Candidatus Nitrosopumilus salaria BD31]|uniref:Uncharacterized protein n=1 Tax=Candidatus Nitrosopumilus salarius BD31 TaxID=859350 RepID=I3D4J5_9ARCH|nr:hypothetical protein [Candidatus Nitrosopumilus salaria]EIJ66638.1 hypothetical protein BD31_I1829 [Candidatus Nitrosopumilus salaria BD31]